MKRYPIFWTDIATEQLMENIRSIALDSGSPEIALSVMEEIETKVKLLETTPLIGAIPKYLTLKRRGFRYLIVSKYLIFYKVDEDKKRVIIHAVFHEKQNYLRLL